MKFGAESESETVYLQSIMNISDTVYGHYAMPLTLQSIMLTHSQEVAVDLLYVVMEVVAASLRRPTPATSRE